MERELAPIVFFLSFKSIDVLQMTNRSMGIEQASQKCDEHVTLADVFPNRDLGSCLTLDWLLVQLGQYCQPSSSPGLVPCTQELLGEARN